MAKDNGSRPTITCGGIIALAGCLVIGSCILSMLFSDRRPQGNNRPPANVAPAPNAGPGARPVKSGNIVTLTDDIFAGRTEAAFDRLVRLSVAKDEKGLRDMQTSGDLLILTRGTQLRILDPGVFQAEVRVESGIYDGRSAWVPIEAVDAN